MAYFVIIRGPLGIGKSTIAKKLATLLDAEYVSIDSIVEEHGLDKVSKEAKYLPTENFIKAQEIILLKIKERLKEKIVIFDACFYHKEQIEHLIQNLPYTCYVFTLKGELEVCIARDSKRTKILGKDAAKAVHKVVSEFDYGIIIDTNNKNINQTVEEIISYLPQT